MSDAEPLFVDREVEALVDADVVSRYQREHRGPYVCAICDEEITDGSGQLVAFIARTSDEDADSDNAEVALEVTHRVCHPSGVIFTDLDRAVPDGSRADIELLSRPGPAPQAIAVIELLAEPATSPQGSAGSLDPRISDLLASGFTTATRPLIELVAPIAPTWSATLDRRTLYITSGDNILFEGEIDDADDWADVASARGQILVVAASRVGINVAGPTSVIDRLEQAIGEGRAVAASVTFAQAI